MTSARPYGSSARTEQKKQRPGRTLGITIVLTVLLYILAFAIGATSLNLGLDLRGGTSVTLQPRLQTGQSGEVTPEAINQAIAIIRQRVDSLGVAESEVTAQGTGTNRQIVISDRKSTRLNSSHEWISRMPSSA